MNIQDTPARQPPWPGEAAAAAAVVARTACVSIEELRSPSRSRNIITARRLLLLVWTEFLARPQQEMSRYLGLSLSGGSALLRRHRQLTAALNAEARLLAQICRDSDGPKT